METPLLASIIRVERWARRNRGWAAALCLLILVILGGASGTTLAARAEARAAGFRSKLGTIELLMGERKRPGWSQKLRQDALELLGQGSDARVRDAFASTLSGIDVHDAEAYTNRCSGLAFDPSGRYLLLGGAPIDRDGGRPSLPAMLWRLGAESRPIGLASPGPVAYRPDGTPVQFVHVSDLEYRLHDLTRDTTVANYAFPSDLPQAGPVRDHEVGLPIMAIADDTSVVAASAATPEHMRRDGALGLTAVWAASGGRLCVLPVQATALAVSPKGDLIATGNSDGVVTVWVCATGEEVATLPRENVEIQSLRFGRNPSAASSGSTGLPDLQLAVGSKSGVVKVFEFPSGRLRSTCRGMEHRVLALSFSPDGTLLLGAGAGGILWDCATGEHLINLPGTMSNAAAFSPDGQKLAVANYAQFEAPGGVTVWRLQRHRGIQILRGLDAPIGKLVFSPDRALVAALSTDWRICVWSCSTGEPLAAFDVPQGYSADNAGLAFSHDGMRLACLAGTRATIWDVTSHAAVWSIEVPRGSVDQLAYTLDGRLIAARSEPRESDDLPRRNSLVRVYDLTASGGGRPIFETSDFSEKVISLALAADGTSLVVEGDGPGPTGKVRYLKVFDLSTLAERRSWNLPKTKDHSSLQIDPTSTFFSYAPTEAPGHTIATLRTGETVFDGCPWGALGPLASLIAGSDSERSDYVSFVRPGTRVPVLRLPGVPNPVVDSSSNLIAWKTVNGAVALANIAQIREQLTALRLDW
jgi:WD40 repeat protein